MRWTCLVAAALLCSCVSATDCAREIPEDLRADAIRAALDLRLVAASKVSREDESLALGAGAPYGSLSQERKKLVDARATAYAYCIKHRVHR